MVSQILRHVTLAVTKAQENETEITEIYFFIPHVRKRQMKENKLISFQLKEELAGLFLGSGHSPMNILGLGPGWQALRLITTLNRLPQTLLTRAGKWESAFQEGFQSFGVETERIIWLTVS